MRRLRAAIVCALTAALFCGAGVVAVPAFADGPSVRISTTDVANALQGVTAIDPSLLAVAPPSLQEAGSAAVADLGDGRSVRVPLNPEGTVELGGLEESVLPIGLPDRDGGGRGELLDGAVAFSSTKRSSNAVIPTQMGVQILTSIMSVDAPTRYDYEITLDEGQRLELANGGVVLLSADGSVVAAAAPPWAKDASGKDIPTRYEVAGRTLTQIVDHVKVADTAYPVVADPLWLAPWVVRCLMGLGLNSVQITRIAPSGSIWAIAGSFGYAAVRCLLWR